MLIVIPTYRRNKCLKWVLKSIQQCDLRSAHDEVRILIANNYPPAQRDIANIAIFARDALGLRVEVLDRCSTIPASENWYSSIEEHARPDEVVFINADDDLLFPWSIRDRACEIARMDADILLARIDTGLMFVGDGSSALYKVQAPIDMKASANLLEFGEISTYAPQHLSNHCYRYTKTFRKAVRRARRWCEQLCWLDASDQGIYMPLYLPYAIRLAGGTVAGLDKPCVLRGRDLNEVRTARYGVPSWNHGFSCLCALAVLKNSELSAIPELGPMRNAYEEQVVEWFLTCLLDPRVNRRVFFQTLREVRFPLGRLASLRLLRGAELIIKDRLGIRGLSLALASRRSRSESTEALLGRLRGALDDTPGEA